MSVVVLSMLSTPAFANMSLAFGTGGGPERTECEAPVMPETLLALLLRPLMLETASVKGIVPPSEACYQKSERAQGGYPKVRPERRWCVLQW